MWCLAVEALCSKLWSLWRRPLQRPFWSSQFSRSIRDSAGISPRSALALPLRISFALHPQLRAAEAEAGWSQSLGKSSNAKCQVVAEVELGKEWKRELRKAMTSLWSPLHDFFPSGLKNSTVQEDVLEAGCSQPQHAWSRLSPDSSWHGFGTFYLCKPGDSAFLLASGLLTETAPLLCSLAICKKPPSSKMIS